MKIVQQKAHFRQEKNTKMIHSVKSLAVYCPDEEWKFLISHSDSKFISIWSLSRNIVKILFITNNEKQKQDILLSIITLR